MMPRLPERLRLFWRVAGAGAFVVAGVFWAAAALFIVSVAFDVLFAIALRAERPSP